MHTLWPTVARETWMPCNWILGILKSQMLGRIFCISQSCTSLKFTPLVDYFPYSVMIDFKSLANLFEYLARLTRIHKFLFEGSREVYWFLAQWHHTSLSKRTLDPRCLRLPYTFFLRRFYTLASNLGHQILISWLW